MLDVSGIVTSSTLYKPWGETRYSSGAASTDYKYTGQLQLDIGIYFYGAKFYDPLIGRFIQPDTIVPAGSQGTQAWDRYAYVNNSPSIIQTQPVIIQSIILGESIDCADGNCTATQGLVVLGKFPKYLNVAKDVNEKVFTVLPDVDNVLTRDQQWELNKAFLDQAVARGDYFYLANQWSEATGSYAAELNYLFSLGYNLSPNQIRLIPPGW